MDKKTDRVFDSALYGVGERIRNLLEKLPDEIKEQTMEIRLRTGKSLALTIRGKPYFAGENSSVSVFPNNGIKVDKKDIEESFRCICKNSVYSRIEEIKNGYISMDFGHRAGIAGTFSADSGFTHISSINIRIARQIFGAASFFASRHSGGGVLIAGPPGSGKTTVLRDFVRQLSSGKTGVFYRVAVIDQRGEIAAGFNGESYNDLGENTDVLSGIEKGRGVEIALRTLYPDYIAFDEIGSDRELESVFGCISCGVNIITTAHIGSKDELYKRGITSKLIKSGAINTIILLPADIEKEKEIIHINGV